MKRFTELEKKKIKYVLIATNMYLRAEHYRGPTDVVSLYTTVDQLYKNETPKATFLMYLEVNGLILPPNPYIDPNSMFIDVEFVYLKPSKNEKRNKEAKEIIWNLVPGFKWWDKDYPPSFVDEKKFKYIEEEN